MTDRTPMQDARADPPEVTPRAHPGPAVCAAVLCAGLLLLGGAGGAVAAGPVPGRSAPAWPGGTEYPPPPVTGLPPAQVPTGVGGQIARHRWPAQASVRFADGARAYACGGTLVSARWVLTAGHCATADSGAVVPARAYVLRVGSRRADRGGRIMGVDRVVRHPAYADRSLRNDVALLHLPAAAREQPLRLIGTSPAEQALWSPGRTATIIGWGATATRPSAIVLREATTRIVSDSLCWSVWRTQFDVRSMLCAGRPATGACRGDSGGPLMVRRRGAFVLAGVTSWGGACTGDIPPGVYARVGAAALNGWLRRTVPTVSLTISDAFVARFQEVRFRATVGPAPAAARLSWDTDGDGAFDDARGPTASAAFARAGRHAVRVQSRYADGDRAFAREVVSVGR